MTDGYENEMKSLNPVDIGSADVKTDAEYAHESESATEYADAEYTDKECSGVSDFKTAHDRICADFESKESFEGAADDKSDGAIGDEAPIGEATDGDLSYGHEPTSDSESSESVEVESPAESVSEDISEKSSESLEVSSEKDEETTDAIVEEAEKTSEDATIAESESSEKPADAETPDFDSKESDGDVKATEVDASADEKLEEQFKQVMFSNLVSKIDYDCTLPTITSAEIADEAGKAVEFGFGSVCILASRMKTFKKQSKTQRFCAVIAYPSGEMTEKSKICEIKEATFGGASEIDVFFRISALKDEKRRLIVRSLVKYGKVIGRKRIYKLSIDSTMVSKEEAQFIVQAAAEAKVDYLVVRNCDFADTRTQLFYAKLCAGKCKLEFAHNVNDLSSMTKLTDIGTERFLLANATEVATRLREELNEK